MDTIKKLNYLLDRKMKWKTLGILMVIIIGSFAELLGVAVVLPIVNLAIDTDFANNAICRIVMDITGYTTREQVMLAIIFAAILIYILKNTYLSWMQSRLYQFSATVKKQMAVRLMKSYLEQPYTFFLKRNTSDLIRSVNQDTAQFYEVISNCLLIASNGFTAMILLLTLVVTNPVMTILLIALLALCAGIILFVVQKRTRRYGRKNQELAGFLIKYLQQTFEGVKEIKIINNESYFIKKYSETYQKQTECVRKFTLANQIPKYMIEAVCIIGIMMYLGANIMYNPDYMSLIPQVAVFAAAAYKILPAVNAVYAYMNTIIYNRASIDLVYRDIRATKEQEQKEEQSGQKESAMQFKDKIELCQVSFRYNENGRNILEKANLEIPRGKSVALIGASGGGKTTTADIALGLLSPTEGEVRADGKNIQSNMREWKKKIGYIPQNIYLTDDSIKNNIAFGIPEEDIDTSRVWEVLEEAQLSEFVKGLEQGVDTKVGERGTRISGGQKQRIGIARALYRNPEILVFDEATSALDNETEKDVMEAIERLHGNKTIIMIAHRLSTIENCDIVYKVENGNVLRVR